MADAAFEAEILEVVAELMKEFGRTITMIAFTEDNNDDAQPWKDRDDDNDPSNLDLFAVVVPPSATKNFGLQALGTGTQWDDLLTNSEKVVIAEGPTDLREYSKVRDGGVEYSIYAQQTLQPGDQILLSYIGLRR